MKQFIYLLLAFGLGITLSTFYWSDKIAGIKKTSTKEDENTNSDTEPKKLPLFDIVSFMESKKYKSGIEKLRFNNDDLVKWIPKPRPGFPPPCDLTICIDQADLKNIVLPENGDFTLKIKKGEEVLVTERMENFRSGSKFRIYSLPNKIPLDQKVSLELSVVYQDGTKKEIVLDEVIFRN